MGTEAAAVTDEAVQAALTAAIAWQGSAGQPLWTAPATGQVRAMLEAATPLLIAAEFERIRQLAERCQAVGTAPDGRNTYFTRIMTEEGTSDG